MELTPLILQLDELLNGLPETPGRTLVLGYSGGVDSEVLAFLLAEYAKVNSDVKVKLIHVHHGLSVNADGWQRHCQLQAGRYQLPFTAKAVEVRQAARTSPEAQARKVRYQALKQEMNSGDVLLTAHHQDDQLETLLLALKRGQGPKGLGAMARLQALDGGFWQLRPLLNSTKRQITDFAAKHNLRHIEDESNRDTQFDRNFLRQDIIPLLKQRWPAVSETASRSAGLCAEQQLLLDEVSYERVKAFIHPSKFATRVFSLKGFSDLSPAWQRQLFRTYLETERLPIPSQVQLDEILRQLLSAKKDARVEINVSGLLIRRFQEQVYTWRGGQTDADPARDIMLDISGALNSPSNQVTVNLPSGTELRVKLVKSSDLNSNCAGIRLPTPTEKVSVRFSLSGNYLCHPSYRHKPRKLKKLWQELRVPPWERNRIPLIFYNEKLMTALGLWKEKCAVSDSEQLLCFET